MRRIILLLIVAAGSAHGDPSKTDIKWMLTNRGDQDNTAARFGFDPATAHPDAKSWDDANPYRPELVDLSSTTIATAADGKAGWVSTHVAWAMQCAGLTGTVAQCGAPSQTYEVTLVVEANGKTWRPIASHVAHAMSDADASKENGKLVAIPRSIEPAAEDAVKVFEATLASPAALAASVSDRKDVVLTGSGPGEHAIGAQVKTKIIGWKLAFTVHDGVAAGTTTSKSIAWVAANLDARPAGSPDAKPTTYRALFVYQREARSWHIVAAHFSFPLAKHPLAETQ
jgi:hypothetical protein